MVKKKVVTSVTINPEIFEMGREEGYNFSQLLEQAIIERSNPTKEIQYLEGIITTLEREIHGYKERIQTLQTIEEKVQRTVFDELINQAKPIYQEHGFIPDNLLNRFSRKLNRKIGELEEDVIYELSK